MSFAQGAPTQPLVLQGSNVFLYGSSTAGNAFSVQQLGAGNVASFVTSTGATSLIINPSGNVGLGTTNPVRILHGYAAAGSNEIRLESTAVTIGMGINSGNNFGFIYNRTNNPLVFGTNDSEKMRILANGNVGIATAANINSPLVVYNPASTSTYTGTTAWGNLHLMPQGTDNAWAGITFGGGGGGTIQQSTQASITVDSNNTNGTKMRFNVGYLFANGALERMTIIGETGNVGIGTVSPANRLHVSGGRTRLVAGSETYALGVSYSEASGGFYYIGATNSATPDMVFSQVGGSERMRITNAGNVGIGTNNPSTYTLQVSGTVGASTSFTRTPASTGVAFAAPGTGLASTDYNLILTGANDTANRLVVFVNGSARTADNGVNAVTIRNDSGNLILGAPASPTILYGSLVGIGTVPTNAAFRTHISGGDSSSTLYGPNATWGAYLNVGAGNTYNAAGRASVNVSNGNLHIDCATGSFQIYLNYFQGGGNGGVNASTGCYGAFFATGDITAFSSDERLKTKVGSIENALDKVCSLTAFKYIHNDIARKNGFTDDNVYVGLSAQEVQKVLPEVVKPAPFDQGTEYDVGLGKSKSGENYLTVQYERIVSLLVEALKEERAERLKVDESLRTTNERLARLEKLLLKE